MAQTSRIMSAQTSQVMVIGAGLGGTAAAAFLAHVGIPVTVVDRRSGPSQRPRARMVSARSLELLRPLGLTDRVIALGEAGTYEIHVVDTLLDAPRDGREPDPTAGVSPTGAGLCDQDLLEGLLRDYAEQRGARFCWGRTVTSIEDHESDVTVSFSGRAMSARFVLLAEGGSGQLRSALGLDALTTAAGEQFFECLFRSRQLDELMADRPGAGFVCANTGGGGILRRDDHRWTITRYARPLTDPVADIAAAAGRAVDVEIISEGRWRPSAALATTFRAGNVFLLGDAAHSMPPSVGMAGNLAIADAHNLAWKIALVLDGSAGIGLLDSYAAERRPATQLVLDEALAALQHEPEVPLPAPILQLGIGYPPATSSALLSEDFTQPVVDPADRHPRIGARLAHQWLPDGRSTIDLTHGTTFVTVGAQSAGSPPLQHHILDTGAEPDGHVWLIRPDGHVAARVRPGDVSAALDRVLNRTAA